MLTVEEVHARRPAWLATTLAALTAVLVLAQARAQPLPSQTAPDDPVLRVTRVNVSTGGRQADRSAFGAVLSPGGRYVAYASAATTLAGGDRNGVSDVFVHDLRTRRTWRASVSTEGAESDGPSMKPSISANGRIVAFPSSASNLVPDDGNGVQDVFVRDRVSGTTQRVSIGRAGEANATSLAALVSADGRVVVFSSDASNLVPDDRNRALDVFVADRATGAVSRISIGPFDESTHRSEASSVDAHGAVIGFRSYAPNLVYADWNGKADVFVHDRRSGALERVNVSSAGVEANAATFRGMVSGDGRFVGFRSRARNLVPADTNRALDAFVHDRWTGATTRVSVASDEAQADPRGLDRSVRRDLFASRPFLSADGRYAAFSSRAANLVPRDWNGLSDVFVRDLLTGTTRRVSVSAGGREANGASIVAGISADGRVVAFTSLADNLVAGDTNGRADVFVVRLRPDGTIGRAAAHPR